MDAENRDIVGSEIGRPAILIIDDDSNNLAIVSSLLEEYHYTILVAEDGESGIKRATLAAPDLVLLDVLMPGIDGFETCRRLKDLEATRDIPVIFMTALSEIEHKVKGFKVGAVDYITKPVQREEVLARVGVHLRLRHLTRELQDANESLEKRVEERTVSLARTNEELQKEIAERKVAEEALALKKDQLETLNRDLEQRVAEEVEKNLLKDRMLFHNARLATIAELLNNIAHQWRQPLNTLGLLLQEAQHDYRQGRMDERSFSTCCSRSLDILNYMSKTINAFQSFFTVGGEAREFNPCEIVEKSLLLVQGSYEQSGIALNVVNEGTVPVTGQDVDFSQVVLNILNNAKDVLVERGTANPAVDILCYHRDGRDYIVVTDNAGGIAEEIMEKIFDPYFTTKFKSQGTGLGLYMSKIIIEKNMGGRLTARNSERGAEFTIEIPT